MTPLPFMRTDFIARNRQGKLYASQKPRLQHSYEAVPVWILGHAGMSVWEGVRPCRRLSSPGPRPGIAKHCFAGFALSPATRMIVMKQRKHPLPEIDKCLHNFIAASP
jgi:hypothetical protein